MASHLSSYLRSTKPFRLSFFNVAFGSSSRSLFVADSALKDTQPLISTTRFLEEAEEIMPQRPISQWSDQEARVVLRNFLAMRSSVAFLTGAGISTDSGVPDYRSPGRSRRRSIFHHEFIKSERHRKRYWMRSIFGFPEIHSAQPNPTHFALAELERLHQAHLDNVPHLVGIITQNVDFLHQKAGSSRVIELHGSVRELVCIACQDRSSRFDFQRELATLNDHFLGVNRDPRSIRKVTEEPTNHHPTRLEIRPDGDMDIELAEEILEQVQIPSCRACGNGILMPDVVFFGGSVKKDVDREAVSIIDGTEALVVAGTTLPVQSSLRLVKRARDRMLPILIINDGATRADSLESASMVHLHNRIGEVIPQVVRSFTYKPIASKLRG